MRYKAFISYSHRDDALARRLHRRLESYRPPRGLKLPDGSAPERLHPVYRDREEMAASPSLPATIEAALAASDHLIVLCSPAAAASDWVNQEIRLFAAIKGADRIVPVIVDGRVPDCFPPAMLECQVEPLAPDLRDGKDGFDDGVLKIIAGLWGVSLGVLKNREAARRRRRARLQAGLAAVFAALAVFAGFSLWRAAEQAARAEAEARMAEARSLATVARATFDRNPGETSVAAMIAVQSLALEPTAEALQLLRDALTLAPLGADAAAFPWLRPQTAVSGDGRVAAFMSALSSDGAPARSEVVRLNPGLAEKGRIAFEGLAKPAFSPDGAWLAMGGHLRRLVVLNASSGATALDQPVQSGFDVAFSGDGATLYAATQLGEVLRWAPPAAKAEALMQAPASGARLAMPMLGAASSGDWLLRAERGQPGRVLPLDGGAAREVPFTRRYEKLAWTAQKPDGALAHPDGAHFIAWDTYNSGALWNAKAMTARWTFDDRSRVSSWKAANVISRDGAHYARARGDGDISVREMDEGEVILRANHGGLVRAAAFLDQPRRVVAAGEGGASVWPVGDDQPAIRCAADADILSLAVETAGTILLGAQDGRLIRCDAATGDTLASRDFGAPVAAIASASGDIAVSLKLSDREDSWAELAFINRETGAARRRSVNEPFDQIVLSEDGARAATRSWAKKDVAIWDTATGDLIGRVAARGDLHGLSPRGDRLLMDYKALEVYDIATGERLAQFGEAAGVSDLIAAPHADLMILAGDVDGVWRHWGFSAGTGRRLWRVDRDVTMAAGGAVFAEYLSDEVAWRMIDRETGAEIGRIPFEGEKWGATPSRDGGRIAVTRRIPETGGASGYEIELWDVVAKRMIWRRELAKLNAPSPRVIDLSESRAAVITSTQKDDGSTMSVMEIVDWSGGETVFSYTWSGFGARTIAVDRAAEAVVISTDAGASLHRLSDGAARWSTAEIFSRGPVFSPDGEVLITAKPGGHNRTAISVRASDTGEVLRTWTVDGDMLDLAVASDGRHAIAALEGDGWRGVKAWRIADGGLAHAIEMDAAPRQIHPLGDPTRLVVRDATTALRVYDLTTGAELRRFGMATRASHGAFSADGKRAVTASGARLRSWKVETGEEIATLLADGQVTALAIRADGGEAAFVAKRKRRPDDGAEASLVHIWRPGTDAPVEALAANDPAHLSYDPTGTTLLIAERKDVLRGIDARTLAPRFVLRPLANGAFGNSSRGRQFTGDGRHLLVRETGSYGQGNLTERRAALRVFDTAAGAEVARLDTSLFGLGVATTASGFFYADVSGQVRHFELGPAGLDRRLDDATAEKALAAPGDDRILVTGYGRDAALIDIHTGERLILEKKSENRRVLDGALARNGRYIALSVFDESGEAPLFELLVLDAATGEVLARTPKSDLDLRNIAFAEGGEAIIAARLAESSLITQSSDPGDLYRWRWREGPPTLLIDDNPVADFTVSDDGAWLLTSEGGESRDTGARFGVLQTRLIRLSDGAVTLTRPHDLYGPRLALSPAGDRLGVFSASSPTEGDIVDPARSGRADPLLTIALEDVAFFAEPVGFLDGGERFVLGERSGARVYSLKDGALRRLRTPWRANRYALSPDGAFLAIGGAERISVWNLRTYERVADLRIAELYRLVFAGADDRALIAVTRNGVFRLEWMSDHLVETACEVYRHDEWQAGRRRIVSTDAPRLCASDE